MLSTAVVLIIIAAVTGSAIMVAITMSLLGRLKALESGDVDSSQLDHLLAEVQSLRAELEVTQSDVGNLIERVDFTERLLGDGSDAHSAETS